MSEREHRFDVFGSRIAIRATAHGWEAFALGNDGKRGPAGFVAPAFVAADELQQYLADLFHESAKPWNDQVTRLA
jgi:hypothetical protein